MTPFKSYVLYVTALKSLLNWPHGLFEFLNAFKRRDQVEPTETVTKDLGCIYTNWLRKSWQPPEFSFLQTAFEQYLQENFAFALALQQQYRSSAGHPTAIEPDYITYPDAAQRLSTSVVVVERLVEIGLLAGYSQFQRKLDAQQFKLVSRDSVSALRQRWYYGIPLYDTVKVLGISKAIILKMEKAGLIKAVSGPRLDGAQVRKIGSQSLAYFFKRLERSGVRYLYDQPVKMISLTEAVKSTAKDGLDTVFLIEQILAGNLRGYWSPGHRNLGQLRVSVADLGTLRRANCGDQVWPMGEKIDIEVATISDGIDCKISEVRLTALQFAQQLGISQEYVWHWTRRGVVMLAPDAELVEN